MAGNFSSDARQVSGSLGQRQFTRGKAHLFAGETEDWREALFPCYFRLMLKEGDKAPDFDLETDEGTRVKLSDYLGKNVVLFFYPKDNTSG